jgi:hypothetical protein
MVPKYPFEVQRHFQISLDKRSMEVKSFETLPAATEYANSAKRMPSTRRVVTKIILDDWNPHHEENGNGNGRQAPG